jgi:hypothetical protein
MDAIQQALAAAKAAAESQAAATGGTAVATAPAANGGVAVMTRPAAPAAKLNMETVSAGNMTVDAWLKPKEFGILVGDKTDLIDTIKAVIDMTDGVGFIVKKGIKAGNPAKYWYTLDGATCTTGGSWEAAVAIAKGMDPKAYEYRCVDLPFDVLEDIVGKKQGVLCEAGKKVGYTTSTTNWKNWEMFYKDVQKANLLNEKVVVEIGYEKRENANKNTWGVLTFKLLGSAEGGE